MVDTRAPNTDVSRPQARHHQARRQAWILAALLVGAVVVRAPRLVESLWYDEIAAWRDYGRLGPLDIVTTYHDPANHVAHTLLTWLTVSGLAEFLGQEVALRLPALVFSLLAIVATWALARRTSGGRVALLAAFVMTVAPVAVLEGTDARGYSMMMAAAAASTWIMLRLAATDAPGRGTVTRALAYGAVTAVGIWAHLMTVFVPAGHALWLLWRAARRRGRRPAPGGLLGLVFATLLTLLLYAPILPAIARVRARFADTAGGERSLLGTEGLHVLLQLGGSWMWPAALAGLALFVLGLARIARRPRERATVGLALLGLPIMIAVVAASGSWTYARFTLFAFPGAALLMALGMDTLWSSRRVAGLLALGAVLASAGADLALRPPRQPLREAASYIRAVRAPDEPVLAIGLRHMVLDVYAADVIADHSLLLGHDLDEKLARTKPSWVILLYPDSLPPDRHDLLAAEFDLDRTFIGWADWGNGRVEVWRRKGPST